MILPEGEIHSTIKTAIFDWGNNQPTKFKPYYGDINPLDIRHKTVRLPIAYRPDVYFKYRRRNGLIIFEVLHSQNNDDNLTWADAILSYLIRDVKRVFFITTATDDKLEVIQDGVLNILRILSSMKTPNIDFLPDDVQVYPISEEEALSEEKVMERINQFAKEDKW